MSMMKKTLVCHPSVYVISNYLVYSLMIYFLSTWIDLSEVYGQVDGYSKGKLNIKKQEQDTSIKLPGSIGLMPANEEIPLGIRCLYEAYSQDISSIKSNLEGGELVFQDQSTLSWSNQAFQLDLTRPVSQKQWKTSKSLSWNHTQHQKILHQDHLLSMMYQKYPQFHPLPHSIEMNFEPGRVRHEGFFKQIYGASARQVYKQLRSINWFGQTLKIHRKAYASLVKIRDELAQLDKKYRRYFIPSSGTYYWRFIKGTKRLSMHSFGIAIDIAVRHAHYWKWTLKTLSRGKKVTSHPVPIPYRNHFPLAVVQVFEKHQWIWGGRWYHHDTMHFEYRPALLHPLCVDSSHYE